MERTSVTIEHLHSPEELKSAIDATTLRIMAGGEYLDASYVSDENSLRNELQGILDGTRAIATEPVALASTQERRDWYAGVPLEDAYAGWESWMREFILESAALKSVSGSEITFLDRHAIFQAFGVNISEFETLSLQHQKSKIWEMAVVGQFQQ